MFNNCYGWSIFCDDSLEAIELLTLMDPRAAKVRREHEGEQRTLGKALDPLWHDDPTSRYFLDMIDKMLHLFCS